MSPIVSFFFILINIFQRVLSAVKKKKKKYIYIYIYEGVEQNNSSAYTHNNKNDSVVASLFSLKLHPFSEPKL